MSDEAPTSHRRAFWMMMGLFLLVAIGLLGLIVAASSPPHLKSSPTAERPWARSPFNQTFDPALSSPVATLLTSPLPSVKMTTKLTASASGSSSSTDSPGELEVLHDTPENNSRDTFYEIFVSDAGHRVTLPDGNQITLTAMALMLPSDVEWGDQRYPKKIPEWIDPLTGAPLPKADWQKEQPVPYESPRLFLRLERVGEAPLRWHWPEAFDARTLQRVSSTSSHSSDDKHGMYWIDLDIWHQTSLKLGVQFAFGEPEIRPLTIEKGASAKFDDKGVANLLEILPNGHGSSSWGGTGTQQRATFDLLPSTTGKTERRSLIFQVWPPQNHYLMEFVTTPETTGRMLSGNGGITSVELHGKEADLTQAQIRRFPKLGRIVIDLPKIPRLPEVANLFETPIPRTEIRYQNSLLRAATEPVEFGLSMSSYNENLSDSLFPMVLTDTTPGEILREYERLVGKQLYLDETNLQITDKKPPGPFEKLKGWWKRTKPSWLP